MDRLERDSLSDLSEQGLPDITDLGVKPASVTEKMPWELAPLEAYAYYCYETPDEKKNVESPNALAIKNSGIKNLIKVFSPMPPLYDQFESMRGSKKMLNHVHFLLKVKLWNQ